MKIDIKEIYISTHERVFRFESPNCKGFAAIHSMALGNPAGGTRYWKYTSEEEALNDILHISRVMTYKFGLTSLDIGGAKVGIIDQGKDRTTVMREYGVILNEINERLMKKNEKYLMTGEDLGMRFEDLKIILENAKKRYVIGTEEGPGDPSSQTSLYIKESMKVCALKRYGKSSLKGLRISIQGIGKTGEPLLDMLVTEEAKVVVTDTDQDIIERVKKRYGSKIQIIDSRQANTIFDKPCDILAPCAGARIITKQVVEKTGCSIICGSANDPLDNENTEEYLHKKGVIYAPDFCANAAGAIFVGIEAFCREHNIPYKRALAEKESNQIPVRLNLLLTLADKLNKSPSSIGRYFVENRIQLKKSGIS